MSLEWGRRNAHRMLLGKPLGNRPRRISRMKWGDGIKMELWEIYYEDEKWMQLT
jgi:hypothetical protein